MYVSETMFENLFPVLFLLVTHFLSTTFGANANTNSTSYISIGTKDNIDYRLSSSLDLINCATLDQPLVIFEFEKFEIIDSMIVNDQNDDQTNTQFLNQFFENHITNVLNNEPNLERPSTVTQLALFKIKNIDQSGSSILYDYPVEDCSVFWFKFQKKNYEISEVNDFIENTCIFLEEYLNVNIDILINTKDTTQLEDLEIVISENKGNTNYGDNENDDEDADSNDKTKQKEENEENDDGLSKIWTEGLIMCLIVSFLLLGILIVALSWIMNIEISYTALEKPTNPLKKTQ